MKQCSFCQETRATVKRNIVSGHYLCRACRRKWVSDYDTCYRCKKEKVIWDRSDIFTPGEKQPFCNTCYFQTAEIQCSCCQERIIKGPERHRASRDLRMKPMCIPCFDNKRPRPEEKCSKCGRERKVAARMENGDPICHTCYNRVKTPKEIFLCSVCQKEKTKKDGYLDNDKNKPVCGSCGQKRRRKENPERDKEIRKKHRNKNRTKINEKRRENYHKKKSTPP